MYYTLLMLDRQLQISESTCDILKRNLETVEAMKEAAMANSAAVEQSRAAYAQVLASLPDIRQSIRETEKRTMPDAEPTRTEHCTWYD